MLSAKDISVVIPLYNKAVDICRTVASVLNQTVLPAEIIIVDDGSTDDGVLVVKRNFDSSLIRIIEKVNGGVSSARNLGIQNVKTKFVAFLDADDEYRSCFIEEMVRLINCYPGCVLFASGYEVVGAGGREKVAIPSTGVYDYSRSFVYGQLVWTSCVVVKVSSFYRVGFFDERLNCGEDLDMWIRLTLFDDCAFSEKICAEYHLEGSNRAMNKKFDFTRDIASRVGDYRQASARILRHAKHQRRMSFYKFFTAGDVRLARTVVKSWPSVLYLISYLPKNMFLFLLKIRRAFVGCAASLLR